MNDFINHYKLLRLNPEFVEQTRMGPLFYPLLCSTLHFKWKTLALKFQPRSAAR